MKLRTFFAATAVALISAASYAQTVDEIIDKHVAATGGMDKIKGVSSIVTDRSMAVQGMEIPSKTTVVVGKSLRSESTIMGNSMVQVVNGSTGWMIRPAQMGGTGDPEDLPAEMVKQQVGQLDPFGPLVNYKEKGTKVELVGKEKVDKKDTYHLKVTPKEGQEADMYLDATTFLLSKIKTMMNGQEGEISFSDYKDVDGIKFPYTMDMSSQMGAISMITNKVILNGKVDSSIFEKPAKK
jgi:uncharacterized protein YxeA